MSFWDKLFGWMDPPKQKDQEDHWTWMPAHESVAKLGIKSITVEEPPTQFPKGEVIGPEKPMVNIKKRVRQHPYKVPHLPPRNPYVKVNKDNHQVSLVVGVKQMKRDWAELKHLVRNPRVLVARHKDVFVKRTLFSERKEERRRLKDSMLFFSPSF